MSREKYNNRMEMGKRIEQSREQLKMSKKEFADKIKIHQNSYTNYIRGTREIPISVLVEISRLCEVSLLWLLTGDNIAIVSEPHIPYGIKNEDLDLIKELLNIPEAKPLIYKFIAENIKRNELAKELDKLLSDKFNEGKTNG